MNTLKKTNTGPQVRRDRTEIIKQFMHILGMRWYHIAIPLCLSLVVSAADAIGLGLLAPLARGVTTGNFSIGTGQPILDNTFDWFISLVQEGQGSIAQTFFVLAAAILGLNAFSTLVSYGNRVFGRYLQGVYKYRLHTAVYDRYFRFGKLYFDRVSQGYSKKLLDYTTRVTELVKMLQDSLTNTARLFAYVLVMAWLSWKLLIFVALVFPVLYFVSRTIMRRVNRWWEQSKEVSMELGRESFSILSAMPLVWSYTQEKPTQQKYARMNERLRQVELKANAFGDLTGIVPRLFALLILIAVVAFISISLTENPNQDITNYIVFLYVAAQTMPLFKVFTQMWASVSEMAPPTREIMRLFTDKRKFSVPSGDKQFTRLSEAIEFSNLSFQYDDRPLLTNVNFTVKRGQFVALVGPSGAGKSTIISLLMRFYDCPSQSILIDGEDIRSFTTHSLRQNMAYVDQDAVLLNDTLRANISYGRPETTEDDLRRAIKAANLEETIERLSEGLNTNVGDRGVQLSGGERQRVALARALIKGSDIILLDEATSALDTITEQRVQAAIRQALRNKTAIVIAHRLSTIKEADYIVYMENGRVKESGTLEQLLALKGAFYAQWNLQSFAQGTK
ncbi:MAG: ABC transporter ATP-binding protein [Candidatus Andersenbacteria bacterium]